MSLGVQHQRAGVVLAEDWVGSVGHSARGVLRQRYGRSKGAGI